MTVAQFGCEIKHVVGQRNSVADFLSRIDDPDSTLTVTDFPLTRPLENPTSDKLVDVELDTEQDMDIDILNTDQINHRHRRQRQESESSENSSQTDEDSPEPPSLTINIARWRTLQREDRRLNKIIDQLASKECPDDIKKRYLMRRGRLNFVDQSNRARLEVPVKLQEDLLYHAHEGVLGAHLGSRKMYASLCRKYHWAGMFRDVINHCDECIPCNTANLTAVDPPLQENPIPRFPFETVSVDLYGPLPKSHRGNIYIVTLIDQLTGWPECRAIPDKSAAEVCRFLMEDLIARHSVPLEMMSDNGTEFVNRIIKGLSHDLKMFHIRCANYSPQANGKCECIHRDFTAYFRKLPQHEKLNWDRHINSILGAYRCADHASAGKSPFFLLYGRDPLYPICTLLFPKLKYQGEDEHRIGLEQMHRAWRLARKNLKARAATNRAYHDQHATFQQLEVGDPVYLKNHNPVDKFDSRFMPHGRITQKLGPYKFKFRDLISGKVTRLNARSLRKATEAPGWGINRPLPTLDDRKTRYVFQETTSEEEDSADDEPGPGNPPPPALNNQNLPPSRKSARLASKC